MPRFIIIIILLPFIIIIIIDYIVKLNWIFF